jgi:hypothetical protein
LESMENSLDHWVKYFELPYTPIHPLCLRKQVVKIYKTTIENIVLIFQLVVK